MMLDISHRSAAIQHGLRNARQIIRDPKGMHADQHVLDACDCLMENGDPADVNEGRLVRDAIRLSWQADAEAEADTRLGLAWIFAAAVGTWAGLIWWWLL